MSNKSILWTLSIILLAFSFSGCIANKRPANTSPAIDQNKDGQSKNPSATTANGTDTDPSNDNDKDLLEYRNAVIGLALKYPKEWAPINENLAKFAPDFDIERNEASFAVGYFDIGASTTVEGWVEQNDFFDLKQYEEPDAYVAHGIEVPITVKIPDAEDILVYFGGASGGGSFGTALFKAGGKIVAVAYSLSPAEKKQEKKDQFMDIVRSIKIEK